MSVNRLFTQRTLWHTLETSWLESTELGRSNPGTKLNTSKEKKLLVEASASLISIGTERTVITQAIPQETAAHMRIPYMQGQLSEQFTYGYSLVGTVIDGPEEWLQRRVHLLHPHQQYADVTIADVYPLPDQLNNHAATLISNMETAVNAVWDAQPTLGDRVVLFGYGLIGTLVSELVRRIPGIDLLVVEPDTWRADQAKNAGIQVAVTAPPDTKADIAINTATPDQALQAAIDCTGVEGTVIDLSWHGSATSSIKLGGGFHYDRKRLISSQVSNIPSARAHRWDYTSRKQLVVKLLLELGDRLSIDQTIAFADAPAFFNSLRHKQPAARSVVIYYQD